jgi:hypothetical protein
MTTETNHTSADGKYRIGAKGANQVALTTIGNVDISTVWMPYIGGSFETLTITDGSSGGAQPVTNFTEADALKTHGEFVVALVNRLAS